VTHSRRSDRSQISPCLVSICRQTTSFSALHSNEPQPSTMEQQLMQVRLNYTPIQRCCGFLQFLVLRPLISRLLQENLVAVLLFIIPVIRRVKGYTRFVGRYVTGRRKRLRPHKVYIFLIMITIRVDLAMSVSPSVCPDER